MAECHLCGEDKPTETLAFDGHLHFRADLWNVARVCADCREDRLMPVLRRLFGGEGINVSAPDPDAAEPVGTPAGHAFSVFETERGTVHVVRETERAPSLLWRARCVGLCGVEAVAEPEPRSRPFSRQEEGVVCGRCARSRPGLVGWEP